MAVLFDRFLDDRKRVFKLIKDELAIDPHCKSYEGSIEIDFEYPNYFEDDEAKSNSPTYCCITLHCYVLGSGRHHEFKGDSFRKALKEFESQIEEWEKKTDGKET